VSLGTYPHYGTCDSCAEGPRPLRETDPETQAWVCEQCDNLHYSGVVAAAEAMHVTPEVASAGMDAYFSAAAGSATPTTEET
jgi:hypothetical protein